MQRVLQASAVIYGLLAAACSLLLGALFLLALMLPGALEDPSLSTVVFSLIALGGGLGLLLAWAGWRGLAGLPSRVLRLPPFWLLVGLFVASVALGELLRRSGVDPLAPLSSIVAALLPSLALVALVVLPLQRAGVLLTRRDLALQFSYGGLVATLLAALAQLVAAFGMIVGTGLLLSWLPGGPEAIQELNAILQSPDLLANPQLLLSRLLTPPLVLAGLLFAAVLVPVLEEVFKSLGVALVVAARGDVSPAQAFAMGVMAGVGFSFVEAVMTSAAIPADGWAITMVMRGGTALIHGLASGLMGMAWQAMMVQHRPGAFLGYAAAAIGLHGAWNASAILGALAATDLASSGSPGLVGSEISPSSTLPLMALWIAAGVALVWLTRHLSAAPGSGELVAEARARA